MVFLEKILVGEFKKMRVISGIIKGKNLILLNRQ